MTIPSDRRGPGSALWWMAVVLFLCSLLLPLNSDLSRGWVGGWTAYFFGVLMVLSAPFHLVQWLSGNSANPIKSSDLVEILFLLTWFANPMSHIATLRLYPSRRNALRRRLWLRVLTGLAFGLALLAAILDHHHYATASLAYFAWVGSMGLMFLYALLPQP